MEAVQRSHLVVRGGSRILEYCGDHEVLDMEDKKVPTRKSQGVISCTQECSWGSREILFPATGLTGWRLLGRTSRQCMSPSHCPVKALAFGGSLAYDGQGQILGMGVWTGSLAGC